MGASAHLGTVDAVILGIFALGVVIGFCQGIIRQIVLLAAVYFGMVLAAQYYLVAAAALILVIPGGEPRAYSTVGLILVFVVTTLAINAVGYLTYRSTQLSVFAAADRLGGALLGILSAWLFVSLLLSAADFGLAMPIEGLEATQHSLLQLMRASSLSHAMRGSMPSLYETLRPWIPSGLPAPFTT